MIKKLIQRPLKFLLVDSTVNILGNLFEQPARHVGIYWLGLDFHSGHGHQHRQPDSCALVWSEKTV